MPGARGLAAPAAVTVCKPQKRRTHRVRDATAQATTGESLSHFVHDAQRSGLRRTSADDSDCLAPAARPQHLELDFIIRSSDLDLTRFSPADSFGM